MTGLTQKQETFCLAYIETGNASEAYRRAYNAENMAPATVNRKAKEVLDNGKIAARVDELRKPVLENALLTKERHLDDLLKLRNLAAKNGKWSAAVQAEMARGKAAGFYSDKVEITGGNGGPVITAQMSEKRFEEIAKKVASEI